MPSVSLQEAGSVCGATRDSESIRCRVRHPKEEGKRWARHTSCRFGPWILSEARIVLGFCGSLDRYHPVFCSWRCTKSFHSERKPWWVCCYRRPRRRLEAANRRISSMVESKTISSMPCSTRSLPFLSAPLFWWRRRHISNSRLCPSLSWFCVRHPVLTLERIAGVAIWKLADICRSAGFRIPFQSPVYWVIQPSTSVWSCVPSSDV
mmetsp:Transcript_4171/g.11970  ORF Transcript_4171/g.11970 Transcript_4171/m.11970 type:complete len:207 (-) Transcript_4171:428-1048(-)